MRLSSIRLAGFKSFVDPCTLPLPSDLTSIVGPNGCGKSNIIDAVRWVLGESSMKQLRSDSMEDVIFNGSKTRKPAGRASIELTFDNSDGTIKGPYAAYSEITVRRELQRDGNSQYYLNNGKCLKRDVTDLFLGTGLAARSGYAIIEQGMVSNMIQARPEELRQWIEEAAGISRYKERRRETETRIRQTRENLARLNDLRVELQGRLETLQRQSKNAEKYKEYKDQERQLKAEHLALRLRALAAQCDSQEAVLAELKQAVETARATLSAAHQAQAGAEAANRQANHALSEQQNRVYEAEAALARQEQNLQHARELKEMKSREGEQIAAQLEELERRETAEQARQGELERLLGELDARLAEAERRTTETKASADAADAATQELQGRWDEFQQRAEEPLFRTEGERVRVQQLERALAQTGEQVGRVESERAGLDAAPIQSSLFDADTDLRSLDGEIGKAQARLQELDRQIQELRDARASEDGALHEARQALQGARGRLASLETLQQAALRQDDAELTDWLERLHLAQAPRLGSVLKVDPGWEAAVEHVLDGLLQAPVIPELSSKQAGLPGPPKSGLMLADASGDSTGHPADRLAAHVRGPAVIADLLSGVRVAPDAVSALKLAAGLNAGESVIAPDGVWRGRAWVRYPRVDEDQAGVLARNVLLRELRDEVEAHQRAVRGHEQVLGEAQTRLATVERERAGLAQRLDDCRGTQAQRMAFRQAQAVRLEQAEAREQQLGQELESLRAGYGRQQQELAEARERLASMEAIAQQLREERGSLQREMAQQREALQGARTALAEAQAARSLVQVEQAGHRSALDALRQALADLAARRQSLLSRRETLETEVRDLDRPIESQAGAMSSARAEVDTQREALRQAREKVEAAETALDECVQQARAAEFAQDEARDKLQQSQIEFQGLSVRRQTLDDQIAESGFDREALLRELEAEATAEAWEEKLAAMTRRIERLGPINLAAIGELEESREREKYFADQDADLTGALDTLEAAIRKIDAETRERFRSTFERVNEIFRQRFPKLFGGGEATLELTGEDLLETGVRVMARPPGKRNSNIQMLSGGEKAMTAVALLLALFELNPAPFCMLDEVDAPLDDANVGRFVEVIREMSGNVQFIIITHNKITMELAEQLHGVTMQEPGVSRLVSVDIQQAVDLASRGESTEAAA